MNEYTLTTEEVETHWADIGFAGGRASFRRWLAEVERAAAEKAWDECLSQMPFDLDWKIQYGDQNPYRRNEGETDGG